MAVAKDAGLDEATIAKVDDYRRSDLSSAHKVALTLADTLMTQPGELSSELASELRAHFTQDQMIEMTLDVMKWNYQKVSVALGLDAEVCPGVLTPLVWDDDGNWAR